MNNKKIIFGILLFCAISFIAYTFANPLEKEEDEGKLVVPGSNQIQNNNNRNDKDDDINEPVKIDDLGDGEEDVNNDSTLSIPTVVQPGNTNNVASRPNNGNSSTSRPSGNGNGGNGGSTSGGNSGNNNNNNNNNNTDPKTYTVTVNVTNGHADESSKKVNNGEDVSFIITPDKYYTLSGASVSGLGCSLNGNTLTASNVTSDVVCSVSMVAEPIYSVISVNDPNIKVSQTNYNIVLTGSTTEMPKFAGYNFGVAESTLVFTAPRILSEAELKNMSFQVEGSSINENYTLLSNMDSAFSGSSKAYFSYDFQYQRGRDVVVTIDWGDGRKVVYNILFDIEVKELSSL